MSLVLTVDEFHGMNGNPTASTIQCYLRRLIVSFLNGWYEIRDRPDEASTTPVNFMLGITIFRVQFLMPDDWWC